MVHIAANPKIVQKVTKKKYFIWIIVLRTIRIKNAVYSFPLAYNNNLIQTKNTAMEEEILIVVSLGCIYLL